MATKTATSSISPLATTNSSTTSTMTPTTTEHDFRFPRRPFAPANSRFYVGDTQSASAQHRSPASTKKNSDGVFSAAPATAPAAAADDDSKNGVEQDSPGDWRLQELNLDFTKSNLNANSTDANTASQLPEFLRMPLFPTLQNDLVSSDQSLEQMREDDPLATQVWKFFKNTKQTLPNQARMENLTWRMMYANMRKCRQEQQERYGPFPLVFLLLVIALCSFCSHFRSLGFPGFPSFP